MAQLVGGACAILAVRALYPDLTPDEAAEAVMPHYQEQAHTDDSLGMAPPDADLEFITRRHDRHILELLQSDARNEPLWEKDIRRLLDVTMDEKAIVVEADRIDLGGTRRRG